MVGKWKAVTLGRGSSGLLNYNFLQKFTFQNQKSLKLTVFADSFESKLLSFSKLMLLWWSTRLAGNDVITSWWGVTRLISSLWWSYEWIIDVTWVVDSLVAVHDPSPPLLDPYRFPYLASLSVTFSIQDPWLPQFITWLALASLATPHQEMIMSFTGSLVDHNNIISFENESSLLSKLSAKTVSFSYLWFWINEFLQKVKGCYSSLYHRASFFWLPTYP